ncbi:MAG: class E sortase [Acidimicrobiia bacterium]
MRRVVGFIGRCLVTAGLLILLFVAYQLWGTGIIEARAQSDLHTQFDRAQQSRDRTTTTIPGPTTTGPGPTTTTAPPDPPPPEGGAVALIKIPRIGVSKWVVQGVSVPDLRKGPGHYPHTPLPGQLGNAAIAGHRTTYGAPFNRLDELADGDRIEVRTLFGTYRYAVTDKLVVQPTQVEVVAPPKDPTVAELTLTTCNPKYSAATRLVIKARLDPTESPPPQAPPTTAPVASTALPVVDELVNETGDVGASGGSIALWGILTLIVGGLWWLMFHRYSRWTTWIAGAIPFAVVLFYFYTYFEPVAGRLEAHL